MLLSYLACIADFFQCGSCLEVNKAHSFSVFGLKTTITHVYVILLCVYINILYVSIDLANAFINAVFVVF